MAEQSPDSASQEETSAELDFAESRWRRYESVMRARIEAAAAAAESRRSRSLVVDAAFLIRDRNRIFPTSLLVGAMASRIVIFLIPLFALFIFGFGLFEHGSALQAGEAAEGAGMPALVAQLAGESSGLSEGFKVAAILGTTWATLYAANSLGRLIRRSAAIVWMVPYPRVGRHWAVPFVVIVLSLISWALAGIGTVVSEWSFELVVGVVVAQGLLLMILWVLVSRILPHDPEAGKWTDFLPGAFFVALGVVALRLAMIVYFAPEADQLEERYGSVAVALVMLTWAYWIGMIVVGSAEINAALFRSRQIRKARREGESAEE